MNSQDVILRHAHEAVVNGLPNRTIIRGIYFLEFLQLELRNDLQDRCFIGWRRRNC